MTGLSILGTAASIVTGKLRLFLEYGLIATVIVTAASAVGLWYRTEYLDLSNVALNEKIQYAEDINEAQDATIAELRRIRLQDSIAISGLVNDYARLAKTDAIARNRLAELAKSDTNIRTYLEHPVPFELTCMFNGTCTPEQATAAGPDYKTTTPAAGALPSAKPEGNTR